MIKREINVFIIFLLVGLWLSGLLFFGKNGFFVLTENKNISLSSFYTNLFQGDEINGSFESSQNYLSTIVLEFEDAKRIEFEKEDTLEFKIKKENSNWIYINRYRSGLIKDSLDFPFGFLPINNSKNKIYRFKISSLNGNEQNYVTSPGNDEIKLLYKFPKDETLKSVSKLTNYIKLKIMYSVTSMDLILDSLYFAIPLFGYLFYILLKKRKFTRHVLYFLAVFLILFDIVFTNNSKYGLTSVAFLFLFSVLIKYKDYLFPSVLALVTIVIWIFSVIKNIPQWDSKLNLWMYLFLVLAFLMLYYFELKKENRNRLDGLVKVYKNLRLKRRSKNRKSKRKVS